jgi:diacylglycerol O-acyltransferase
VEGQISPSTTDTARDAATPDAALLDAPASRAPSPTGWFWRSGKRPAVALELVVVAWLWWVYDAVNNLSPVRHGQAVRHGESLFRLQRRLHLDLEPWLNQWVSSHHAVGVVLANFYNSAHLIVTFSVLGWLWWRHGSHYRRLRTALVTMNIIGFVVFWLYPLAPPRLVPSLGFHDVVFEVHAIGNHSLAPETLANQFAAMPSLHIAWALWCVVVWLRTMGRRRGGAVGAVHLTLTVLAVIGTGNHYVLDVVAGAATTAVALGLAAVAPERPLAAAIAKIRSAGS